jgi:hypothetical protein
MGGRKPGSRGKYPKSIWQKLAARGDREAVDLLSEVANSQMVNMNERITAMGMLASYQSGKRPAYRYVQDVVKLPAPQTVAEAMAYIGRITQLMGAGQLDIDGANAIISGLQTWIESKVALELSEKLERGEALLREYEARGIGANVVPVGGLPVPPGFEGVRMPHLGPPTIEAKPNPWQAPDVGSAVQATPNAQKRPPRRSKPKPDPKPSTPKTPPEPPEGSQ